MVGDYARSLKELRRFAEACEGKARNVYVAPNPTRSTVGTRHTAADVTHWGFFLIDVDPLTDAENPDPMPVLDKAIRLMGDWTMAHLYRHPPIIIDSGRGAQAWFPLEHIIFDDSNPDVPENRILVYNGHPISVRRKAVRKAQGYWLKKLAEAIGTMNECRIDTSCSDLPRLMRCPGTTNQKTGRRAAIVHPGEGPIEGLAQHLMLVPDEVYSEPDPTEYVKGRTWQLAFSDLTRMAQQYLLNGQEEPGRHKVMWHTARKLCEVGCTREECRRALRRANSLAGEDQELSVEEIDHAIETAYGKEVTP